ncbi:MAG TPA: tRNA pseudouridine(55) synthase TruB [Candidatus Limnocylindria bacterium]|nr:tRNA pseudouridine(55) synthase TruB [Candidatus Limnocylindria bacterium]
MTSGLLLVDKDEGVTSAGVIRTLKGALGRVKAGHLGTLDPFASGLLPLCLGEATKVARYLLLEDKAYAGTIQLGSETDTLDRTGAVVACAPVPALDDAALADVAARFTGAIRQVPPMYSALKRDGVPLYELARRGESVERAPRAVEVRELTLRRAADDRIALAVRCSKGTYVRVLAADIARALGTVGHLATLRRTAVGPFTVEQAWPAARLLATPRADWPLVSVRRALAGLETFVLAGDAIAHLRRGRQGALRQLPHGRPGQTALLVSEGAGDVEAVIEVAGGGDWRLVRMLRGAALQDP